MKAMERLKIAIRYMEEHKKAFEVWSDGAIKEVWTDKDGNLCIKYESGNWWHYKKKDNGEIEWW